MIYTQQTKTIIAQICRFPNIGIPKFTKEKWDEIMQQLYESKISMDIFVDKVTGEPRLFVFKKVNHFWKISKIYNDLVFLTDGVEEISENQLIQRYDMYKNQEPNRVVFIDNNRKDANRFSQQ